MAFANFGGQSLSGGSVLGPNRHTIQIHDACEIIIMLPLTLPHLQAFRREVKRQLLQAMLMLACGLFVMWAMGAPLPWRRTVGESGTDTQTPALDIYEQPVQKEL